MKSSGIEKEMRRGAEILGGRDPVIGSLARAHGLPPIPSGRPPFESLVRAILSQQISGKAASTIIGRVEAMAGGLRDPVALREISEDDLARCGVSGQKRRYLGSLLEHLLDGDLDIEELGSKSDEEVLSELTAVTGIGTWTAKMFLIFTLGRLDILPYEDLGVRNGVRIAYDLDDQPTESLVRRLSEEKEWGPYRTIASWYMWRATETSA